MTQEFTLLSAASGQKAVLVLHGFTGTPFEVRPLSDRLEQAGYLVHTPVLAGHSGDLAALEATDWPDWLRSAENAFDGLVDKLATMGGTDRVAVVGFSMGGLLALRLAATRPQRVSALAVLAAPLRLRAAQVRGIKLLGSVPRALRWGPWRAVPKFLGSDVSLPELKHAMPGLGAMPVLGLQSLLRLMAVTRDGLGDVRAPVLVAHGRNDRAVPIADSYELARRLEALAAQGPQQVPAPVIERLWLERSSHLVGVDVEQDHLADAIATFLSTRARW